METQGTVDERTALLISGSSNRGLASSGASRSSVANEHFTGRRQKLLATLCILVTELCERLTFYGVTANLVLFCSSELDLEPPWPSTISYLFQGWLI